MNQKHTQIWLKIIQKTKSNACHHICFITVICHRKMLYLTTLKIGAKKKVIIQMIISQTHNWFSTSAKTHKMKNGITNIKLKWRTQQIYKSMSVQRIVMICRSVSGFHLKETEDNAISITNCVKNQAKWIVRLHNGSRTHIKETSASTTGIMKTSMFLCRTIPGITWEHS